MPVKTFSVLTKGEHMKFLPLEEIMEHLDAAANSLGPVLITSVTDVYYPDFSRIARVVAYEPKEIKA